MTYPNVPPTLSAQNPFQDIPLNHDDAPQRSVASLPQSLTPYLGLRSRLSQVWINKWTILTLLVLTRVLIAIGNLHSDIDSAKIQALSACSNVESMGSTMASLPHYMATGTNELAANGIEKAVNGLHEMLSMTVTGVEAIFLFVVQLMYGTYECLITVAVGSASHAAISFSEDATKVLNSTLGDIGDGLAKAGSDFETSINNFLKGFNDFDGWLSGDDNKPPQIDLSKQIDALKNVKLPHSILDDLDKLDKSIPTFEQVHNQTNGVLKEPFELVKDQINTHLGNYTFNRSAFPVPQRKQLSFCDNSDGIHDFFDGLYHTANVARKVFIAIMLLIAIIACIPVTIRELRRWRTMKERAQLVSKRSIDPLDVIYIASRPYTAAAGLKASQNFASPRKQVMTRWFVAYITSPPALIVLALGIAGLFSALSQYILLKVIQKEVPGLAHQVGQFADKVVRELDTASAEWANGTNTAIIAENHRINENVFGWVNTSTTSLNNTLDSFVTDTTRVLNDTFGGTVLYDPIEGLFKCLIELKIEAVQKGLTWAKNNAHIDFPLFPNDTFSAGAAKAVAASDPTTGRGNDSFVADPGSAAADKVTAAVLTLTDKLLHGVQTEAYLATGILVAYLIVVLMGLARVAWVLGLRRGGAGSAHVVSAEGLEAGGAGEAAGAGRRDSWKWDYKTLTPPPMQTAGREANADHFQEAYGGTKGGDRLGNVVHITGNATVRNQVTGTTVDEWHDEKKGLH